MICGIDEAGRGPLAGPVCAAAVVLGPHFHTEGLNDSKKLSPRRREEFCAHIMQNALFWGLAWASAQEIDQLNILQASLLAMRRAWLELEAPAQALVQDIVVDGNICPNIDGPVRALVRADALVPEVMAASILAKTARDRAMLRWDWIYPDYGFAQHKGYPTLAHRQAIAHFGPSPIQRMSFSVKI